MSEQNERPECGWGWPIGVSATQVRPVAGGEGFHRGAGAHTE
jgi:hypothetical protein